MGKRKIAIEKIVDRQKRSVTFTKRRDGLFKKAETACQKFGLQIGIVVFSPAGKPFTFCNSSSVSVDAIIDAYLSSSLPSSSAMVVGGKRSRPDDVQVIERREMKKKRRKTMMNDDAVVIPSPPPCIIAIQDEEEEKLDEGFHYKNLADSENQTHDQEEFIRNELFMGFGGNATEEMNMVSSQNLMVEGDRSWAPDVVELQEIANLDDFEFDVDHHHQHCDAEIMGLLPPSHTTAATSTSFCNSIWASDLNEEEEVAGDISYTIEEWEHIFSTSSPTGDDWCTQEDWPTQEFVVQFCT